MRPRWPQPPAPGQGQLPRSPPALAAGEIPTGTRGDVALSPAAAGFQAEPTLSGYPPKSA